MLLYFQEWQSESSQDDKSHPYIRTQNISADFGEAALYFPNETGRKKMVQTFNWYGSCESSSQERNWVKPLAPQHVAETQVEVQRTCIWLRMLMAITDFLKVDCIFSAI